MKYLFQRGQGLLSASPDATLFHFGEPPGASPGPCYSCLWPGSEPTVILTHGSRQHTLPLEKIDDSTYSFSHKAFDRVTLVKSLWYESRPRIFPRDGVVLSFQGWDQGLWYDGIYSRQRAGKITDILLAGTGFQVQWSEGEGEERERGSAAETNIEEWFLNETFFAQKQSLIRAVRARWGATVVGETALVVGQGSAEEVLSLLLFRLAFLTTKFVMVPSDEGLKRLAQNLNILPTKSLDPKVPCVTMAIDWGSSQAVHKLLRWQLHKSPFIPGRLWARIEALA